MTLITGYSVTLRAVVIDRLAHWRPNGYSWSFPGYGRTAGRIVPGNPRRAAGLDCAGATQASGSLDSRFGVAVQAVHFSAIETSDQQAEGGQERGGHFPRYGRGL